MSTTLFLLQGVVALLLAIGCGNVSILLLARGTARQHELAVRAAVGAGRRRIVRQLLTEALLLAAVGAVLGVAMSYGILALIRLLLPRWAFAPEVVIRIHLPELLFSVAVALATAALFGLWPALRISQTRPGEMLTSTRRVAGSVGGRRTHNALVGGQIALTLLILAAAGAATEGFVRLMHTPLGFDPHNVMVLAIPLRENTYSSWRARGSYFEALRSKVNETPGVAIAAIASNAVPPRNGWYQHFEIMGQTAKQLPKASINMVSPQYFRALGIPLIAGRLWDDTETRGAAHVALINRTLAQCYFPNGEAIGHGVKLPDVEDRPPRRLATPNLAETWLTIVGVVADAKNDGLRDPVTAAIYVPYTLDMTSFTQIVVKTQTPPLPLAHAVRVKLAEVDQDQQIYDPQALETWISEEPEWQRERLVAWIFGLFAGLALVLAAVGLYSVVTYTVAQRVNEFGIRLALGAERGHLMRIVFASVLGCVGGGMVVGLALAVAMNRIIGQWGGSDARDPLLLLAGMVVLSLVAMLACAVPARRAAGVDPMLALRRE
jgi:predicted permease